MAAVSGLRATNYNSQIDYERYIKIDTGNTDFDSLESKIWDEGASRCSFYERLQFLFLFCDIKELGIFAGDDLNEIMDSLNDKEKHEVLNAEDENGDTLLTRAAKQKNYFMVKFLLSYQIPIRSADLAFVQQLLMDASRTRSDNVGRSCDYDETASNGFYLYNDRRKVVRITDPSEIKENAVFCLLPAKIDEVFSHFWNMFILKKGKERHDIVLFRFDNRNRVVSSVRDIAQLARRIFPINTMVIQGHGNSEVIKTDLSGLTEKDFQDGTFSGFESVRLDSCSTGREDKHGRCLAKSLSLKPGSEQTSFYAASDSTAPSKVLYIENIPLFYNSGKVPSVSSDIREILAHISVCYKNGEKVSVFGGTPLIQAVANNLFEDANKLVESCDKDDLFKQDAIGMTVLHYAAIGGIRSIARKILERLSVDERKRLFSMENWRGDRPLDTAEEVGIELAFFLNDPDRG